VVAPHLGDLDSPRSVEIFERLAADLQQLYGVEAQAIACDLHPRYASSRWALAQNRPLLRVQHHQAHAAALAGERPEVANWLVFAWDGFGFGDDGTLWGGEVFAGAPGCWRRVASLQRFRIVGGDAIAREPWRSAAALMWTAGRAWMPPVDDAAMAATAWRKSVNTVTTSSAGRLFDAAASLLLGLQTASFEGQGPMQLESLAQTDESRETLALPLAVDEDGILRCDWAPLLDVLSDSRRSPARRARIFHNALADAVVAQAAALAARIDFAAVGLGGGVFQNRLLAERAIGGLRRLGIAAHLPERLPAGDGGLAFGQLVEVAARSFAFDARDARDAGDACDGCTGVAA
jgi:hydrogenase maturation protein HypF